MIDANIILDLFKDQAKLSLDQINDLISQKSPLPVPGAVVEGVLNQLVQQNKIQKTEENGQIFYHL